jgi:hypothetical protein
LRGRVDSLALHDLSPYSEYLLGYELVSGQLDHDFDIAIRDSAITASNELKLRKARVEKLDHGQPEAPLPMPLGFALDLLRDGDDNIELSVPLEGRLDDPELGMGQVISRALGKALRSGSTTFLKFALQPYGAIWAGAEMGLKAAGRIRLDPMSFPAGSAELGPEQADYAAKLAQILTDRPQLELQICGKAGSQDYSELQAPGSASETSQKEAQSETSPPISAQEQQRLMVQLAEERGDALKRWLVAEKGIAPQRLYPCKPAADPEGDISGLQLSL